MDTDFTAKLVDVWPERLRAEPDRRHPPRPLSRLAGEARADDARAGLPSSTVELWSTSNVFKKGHVLRLEVSSSNFPRFDRNLNTGEENGRATRFVSATNTILHDAEHPSALIPATSQVMAGRGLSRSTETNSNPKA